MDWNWLKAPLPRGLYARAALILLLPVLLVTTVVSVALLQRHFDRVTRQMTDSIAWELRLVAAQVDAVPDAAAAQAAAGPLAAALGLELLVPAPLDRGTTRRPLDFSGRALTDELASQLPGLMAVDLGDPRRVAVTLAGRHGPLRIAFARGRVSAANPHQLLVMLMGSAVLGTLVAALFLRGQVRPIRRLARAAEAFGRGQVVPFRPAGATEIRMAGTAFLDMRARIERQIESRTLMLTGVSHDLRTPLTRLRLGLAALPDDAPPDPEEIAALQADAAEMAAMLDAFLDFARGAAAEAPASRQPARAFVAAVVADAQRLGQPVSLRDGPEAEAVFRPEALRRALQNLIGNAVRHGARVEVELAAGERSLRIAVEDDGPGIPEEAREQALRPFVRLDPARNLDDGGGVGLGLAIAADIARAHGGSLRLGRSAALGGLAAELVLPR